MAKHQVLDAIRREEAVQVEAIQGGVPIYSITPASEKVKIGEVRYRDYDERAVRVPTFIPSGEDTSPHSLGHASGQFKIIDHYSVLDPLLQEGFRPEILKHFRGGSEVLAVMTHPDLVVPDEIGWDRSKYSSAPSNLKFAVRVKSSLHFGTGIRATLGFFRIICTNGLISVALGMGHTSYKHTSYGGGIFREWINARMGELNGVPEYPSLPSKVLDWPIRALEAVSKDEGAIENYPKFAAEPIGQLQRRLPAWGLPSLAQQLEMARSADSINPLDLLNMLTNSAQEDNRSDDGISWMMYRRMDPLFRSLYDLVEIGAFHAGSTGFRMNLPSDNEIESN